MKMYRDGKIYDEIDKVIIDIYMDYNIISFPINEEEVCKKMGVSLVPYSCFSENGIGLLHKKSEYGFWLKNQMNNRRPFIIMILLFHPAQKDLQFFTN